MKRIIKGLIVLALIAFSGLVGFAYLGNLEPEQKQVTQPVTLDAGS